MKLVKKKSLIKLKDEGAIARSLVTPHWTGLLKTRDNFDQWLLSSKV